MNQHSACIGMIESTSIAKGIEAADAMLKAANVGVLFSKTICPGKYAVAVCGDVAAVEASVEAGKGFLGQRMVDWLVIPNLHQEIPGALCGIGQLPESGALGIIETYSATSIVLAADAAVKAADVALVEIRLAMGLGGKGCALFCGDVAAVRAAVDAGVSQVGSTGLLVEQTVIPQPMPELWKTLA